MTSAPVLVPSDFTNGTLEHVRINMRNTKHLSQVLQRARIHRQTFDPNNVDHRAAYLIFMQTGKWVIHFYGEWPYQSVVSMAQAKLLEHFLQNDLTQKAADRLRDANKIHEGPFFGDRLVAANAEASGRQSTKGVPIQVQRIA